MGSFAVLLTCVANLNAQDKWADYFDIWGTTFYEIVEECGNTTINGKNYTILAADIYDIDGDSVWQSGILGYKRESNDSIFIYGTPNAGSSEYLLYVYNVQVNDTVNLGYIGGGDFIVVEVDSILFAGEPRRKLRLRHSTSDYEDIWIEGVGSIFNGYVWRGLPPYISYGGRSEFSCYYSWEHDTIWSPYDSLPCLMEKVVRTSCDILTSSMIPVASTSVTLYPNPFSGEIHVIGIPFPCKLSVYDFSGKAVIQSTMDNNETTINTAHLANGMYYIVLLPERGNPITIKAIKI